MQFSAAVVIGIAEDAVTYHVTYTAAVNVSGQTISNTADGGYTSLPGPNGTSNNPTGSTTPGATGAANGERDGSGGVIDYWRQQGISSKHEEQLRAATVRIMEFPDAMLGGAVDSESLIVAFRLAKGTICWLDWSAEGPLNTARLAGAKTIGIADLAAREAKGIHEGGPRMAKKQKFSARVRKRLRARRSTSSTPVRLSCPDKKISENFLAFATPLLELSHPDVTEADLKEPLELASTVWNAVVYADAVGNFELLDGLHAAVAQDPPLAVLVEQLVERKRKLFGDDHRLVGKHKIYRKDGQLRFRAEARVPSPAR